MSSSLKQVAYQHLRKRLLSGELPPGHRISPDASARELGMSQTPVREAIGLLESDGLVEQVPNAGAFVRRIDRRELAELYDVRILLEGFAAARAAKRIRGHDLAELERLFVRMRELARQIRDGGVEAFRGKLGQELALVDASFHLTLLRAAGNRRILKIVEDLHVLSRLMTFEPEQLRPTIPAEMALQVRIHGRLLHAIRRHDAKAAKWWMVHQHRITKKLMVERFHHRQGEPVTWTESLLHDIRRAEHDMTVKGPAKPLRRSNRPRH